MLKRTLNTAKGNDKPLSEMSCQEIITAVSEKYSQVADAPTAEFNFPVGRKFAESVGYPQDLLDKLPESIYESFTGAGNPQDCVVLTGGETLLDLGCGAGLDLYLYAQKTGETGQLYGLDASRAMLDKAQANMDKMGIENCRFFCSPADRIPLDENVVDIVTSNGIYNLSPDKEAVMREVFRILKPGGRTIFSEIVLKERLPEEIRKNINDWFRCIGGALTDTEFIQLMSKTGFVKIEMMSKNRNARCGHALAVCANVRAYKP